MKTQKTELVTEVGERSEVLFRVAGGSQVKLVAGAISRSIREGNIPVIVAIGAGAVNQALKAICVSQGMIAPEGYSIVIKPGFRDEFIGGRKCTAMSMKVVSI
jgi:stage V sporulation protein S